MTRYRALDDLVHQAEHLVPMIVTYRPGALLTLLVLIMVKTSAVEELSGLHRRREVFVPHHSAVLPPGMLLD